MMHGMVIDMEEARLHTLAQVKAFLDGTAEGAFRVSKMERHRFIERVLTRFGYAQHGRGNRGVLLRYLERMTGLSRQQVTQLVRQYRQNGTLSHRHRSPTHGFLRRFTAMDMATLADMDALHGTVSGRHQEVDGTGIPGVQGCPLRTAGGDFGVPSVQPAGRDIVPAHAAALDQDAANGRAHRPAPRNRMGCRVISGSTACIRATKTG